MLDNEHLLRVYSEKISKIDDEIKHWSPDVAKEQRKRSRQTSCHVYVCCPSGGLYNLLASLSHCKNHETIFFLAIFGEFLFV